MNSDEIEQAIDQFLIDKKIDFDVRYVAKVERDGWKCDRWRYALLKDNATEVMSGDYFTGLGHRKASPLTLARKPEFHNPRSIGSVNWDKKNLKPVEPSTTSVLYSLVLDAYAIEVSFKDWCWEYGYNEDSIKDLNTYNACCETGDKLRKLFTQADLEWLRETLQDY